MLSLVVTLLIIALIAAVLGFGGIAIVSVEIAKIIFFVAIVLFLIAAVWIVVAVNRRTSARAPLGSEWPSVGQVRPGFGIETASR